MFLYVITRFGGWILVCFCGPLVLLSLRHSWPCFQLLFLRLCCFCLLFSLSVLFPASLAGYWFILCPRRPLLSLPHLLNIFYCYLYLSAQFAFYLISISKLVKGWIFIFQFNVKRFLVSLKFYGIL